MKRKFLLVLILALVFAGIVFAEDSDFATMPKNTITVDIGPTFVAMAWNSIGELIGSEDVKFSSFGIAAQYERQIQEKVSIGGRFAYLSSGIGIKEDSYLLDTTLVSFSLEAHFRYYPSGDVFFIDGMLGYANLSANFSGTAEVEVEDGYGYKYKKPTAVSYVVPRDYLKFGGKIGWRVDFGNPGGFVFEPSFGWYGGFGLGDTIGAKYRDKIGADIPADDILFWYLENWIFVGGPRLSLAFGIRF